MTKYDEDVPIKRTLKRSDSEETIIMISDELRNNIRRVAESEDQSIRPQP